MSTYFAQSLARALNTTTTLSTESVDVDINIGNDAVTDEDGAIISPLAPETDEPIIEAQETQIAEEIGEADETETELDSAEEDIETLESIHNYLGKSLDGGGLDTVSYEMLNITMDHIFRKYGIATAAVMPSMESFGDDKVGQTQISMEKVREAYDNVKAGAGAFLKKLWFQIKKIIGSLIKLNWTMDRRLDAMIKAAGGLDSNAKAGNIKLYAAKRLLVGGKLPSKRTLITNFSSIVKAVQMYGIAADSYFRIFADQQAAILSATDSEEDKTNLAEKTTNAVKAYDQLKGILIFQDAELVVTTRGVGEGKSLFPGIKLKTTPAPADINADIEALSPSEIKDLARNIKTANANFKALDKTTNNKALETLILKLADKKDGKLTKEIKRSMKDAVSVHQRMMNYFAGVSKGMADYCAQSLNEYKKTDKAGKAGKATPAAPEPAAEPAA